MEFKLDAESFPLLKKYVDFSELSFSSLNDNSYTVEIKENELDLFLILVCEASSTYGLDSDGEITDFGRKLEALYDKIFSQI